VANELNPFDQIFDALWNLVDDSIPLAALVKLKNTICFNKPQDRDPQKQNVQVADLPELVLLSDGASATNLHFSSCGAMCRRHYSFIISTGDNRISLFLNQVEFALQCALLDTQTRLGSLTWRGNQFVKKIDWDTLTDGIEQEIQNRGLKGWSSVWSSIIEIHIAQVDLRNFNDGTAYVP